MSKGTITNTFEEFCQCLINEQDRLFVIGQFSSNQALMVHNKGNHNKGAKKNPNHILKDLITLLLMFLVMLLVIILVMLLVMLVRRKGMKLVSIVENFTLKSFARNKTNI